MSFPKGINKIIEEYCCYELPFEIELLSKTIGIFNDTKRYISYPNYFIDSYTGKINDTGNIYKIRKIVCGWDVINE